MRTAEATATLTDPDDLVVEGMRASAAAHLALAGRMLGNAEDAREALQEAHFRAWRHRDRVRDRAAVQGWLRQIVVRESLRLLRRRAMRRWLPFGEAVPDMPCPAPIAEHTAADQQILAMARAAVERLPPRQRLVWGLRFDEGWSTREIATATELSPDTVKTHLTRALESVTRQLELRHAV